MTAYPGGNLLVLALLYSSDAMTTVARHIRRSAIGLNAWLDRRRSARIMARQELAATAGRDSRDVAKVERPTSPSLQTLNPFRID